MNVFFEITILNVSLLNVNKSPLMKHKMTTDQ